MITKKLIETDSNIKSLIKLAMNLADELENTEKYCPHDVYYYKENKFPWHCPTQCHSNPNICWVYHYLDKLGIEYEKDFLDIVERNYKKCQ